MTDDELKKLWDEVMPYVRRDWQTIQAGRRLRHSSVPAKLQAKIPQGCNACERPRAEWYMMRHDLWRIVNPVVHGHLCMKCLKERAIARLGRPLRRSDFGRGDDQPMNERGDRLPLRNESTKATLMVRMVQEGHEEKSRKP
jgi:hypothetical protein